MMRSDIIRALVILIIMLCLSLQFFSSEAFAADSSGHWRPTFDLVMRWLNFGILVFLLIKFGKNPLMNLLRQRKEELQREIIRAEEQRQEAEAKVKEANRQLDESIARLEEIKDKIIKQGEIKKQKIIQDARLESKIILEESKRRIDTQVLNAKKMFQAEMVDEAMKIVFQKLPRHITQEDNQKFLDQFLSRVLSE